MRLAPWVIAGLVLGGCRGTNPDFNQESSTGLVVVTISDGSTTAAASGPTGSTSEASASGTGSTGASTGTTGMGASGSSGSSSGGMACMPDPACAAITDGMCLTCLKDCCCMELAACWADGSCQCAMNCVEALGLTAVVDNPLICQSQGCGAIPPLSLVLAVSNCAAGQCDANCG